MEIQKQPRLMLRQRVVLTNWQGGPCWEQPPHNSLNMELVPTWNLDPPFSSPSCRKVLCRLLQKKQGHQPSHKILTYSLSCLQAILGTEPRIIIKESRETSSSKWWEQMHSLIANHGQSSWIDLHRRVRKDQRNQRCQGHHENTAHRNNWLRLMGAFRDQGYWRCSACVLWLSGFGFLWKF